MPRLRRQLTATALVFILCTLGLAQQDPVAQLKQRIAEMEAVDRDPTTPAEVRKINRDFLRQRRQELWAALRKGIADLQKYQSRVSLSPAEKEVIAATIASKEADLATLETLIGQISLPADNTQTANVRVMIAQPKTEQAEITSNAPAERSETGLAAHGGAAPADCTYPDVPEVIKSDVDKVASDIVERNDVSRIGNINQRAIFFAVTDALTRSEAVKVSALKAYIHIGQTTRTDTQLGTTAASGGSTSAIEKPGWSDLLGFAIEHGAIQQQTSTTTLTLSTTPYALFVPSQDDTAAANRQYGYLKRLGLSASFNISDKNTGLLNVRRKNLSQYSAKLRLTPERGPNTREFDDEWNTLIKPAIQNYLNTLSGGIQSLFGPNMDLQEYRNTISIAVATDVQNVLTATRANLGALSADQQIEAKKTAKAKIASIILCALKTRVFDEVKADGSGRIKVDKLTADHIVATVLPSLIAARKRVGEARELYDQMMKDFERKPEASLSFTNNRPTTGTEFGTFNFLYQRYLGDTPVKFTFNTGPSFYHRPDPAMNQKTFRDFVTTLSFEGHRDSPFKTTELDLSPMTYSLTARYQRLQENKGIPKKKADLAIVQFKLEVPVAKGFSVPLSLTYANATEQNREKNVRGNFGITFDVDKFLAIKKILAMVQ